MEVALAALVALLLALAAGVLVRRPRRPGLENGRTQRGLPAGDDFFRPLGMVDDGDDEFRPLQEEAPDPTAKPCFQCGRPRSVGHHDPCA